MPGAASAAAGAARKGATAAGKPGVPQTFKLSSDSIQDHYRAGKKSSNMSAAAKRQISLQEDLEKLTKTLVRNSSAFMQVMGPILEVIGLFWDALVIAFLPIIIEVIKGLAQNARKVLEWAIAVKGWLQDNMELVKAIATGIVIAMMIIIAVILVIGALLGIVVAIIGLIIFALWEFGKWIGEILLKVFDVIGAFSQFIHDLFFNPIHAIVSFLEMIEGILRVVGEVLGGLGGGFLGAKGPFQAAGGWVSGAADWINPFD